MFFEGHERSPFVHDESHRQRQPPINDKIVHRIAQEGHSPRNGSDNGPSARPGLGMMVAEKVCRRKKRKSRVRPNTTARTNVNFTSFHRLANGRRAVVDHVPGGPPEESCSFENSGISRPESRSTTTRPLFCAGLALGPGNIIDRESLNHAIFLVVLYAVQQPAEFFQAPTGAPPPAIARPPVAGNAPPSSS